METRGSARRPARPGLRVAGRMLAALAGLTVVAGCGQTPGPAKGSPPGSETGPLVVSVHRGLPDSVGREFAVPGRPLAFIVGPGRLDLATWGSSSCPQLPVRAERTRENTLRVVLDDTVRPDDVCSADAAATTARIRVDDDLIGQRRLVVVLVFPQQRAHERIVARRGVS
jgi:hypothetical protein